MKPKAPTGTAREGREKQGVRLRGSPLFSLDPRAAPLYDVQYLPFACRTAPRKGGRAAECGGLENRFASNRGNEGSNPSPSAS